MSVEKIRQEVPDINESGLDPYGFRVLVKMKLVEEKTAGGIIIPDDKRETLQMGQVKGQLVAVGELAYADLPDAPKIGDYIFVKKYAGTHIIGDDGEAYRLCNDNETGGKFLNEGDLDPERVI